MDRITRVDDIGVVLDSQLNLPDNILTSAKNARGVLGILKKVVKEI